MGGDKWRRFGGLFFPIQKLHYTQWALFISEHRNFLYPDLEWTTQNIVNMYLIVGVFRDIEEKQFHLSPQSWKKTMIIHEIEQKKAENRAFPNTRNFQCTFSLSVISVLTTHTFPPSFNSGQFWHYKRHHFVTAFVTFHIYHHWHLSLLTVRTVYYLWQPVDLITVKMTATLLWSRQFRKFVLKSIV